MRRVAFLLLSAFSVFAGVARSQTPLSPAFTYQGELSGAGTPVTGTYDIRFRLYDAATDGNQIGGTFCSDNVTVTGGRFAVSLDFGPAAFAGQRRYLEIEVRQDTGGDCSDETGYTLLSPRQELTATPQATFAQAAGAATTAANAANLNGQGAEFYQNAANLTGTIPDGRLSSNVALLNANQTFTGMLNFSNAGNTFTGMFNGNGSGLTNLSGQALTVGSVPRASLGGDTRLALPAYTGDWSRTPYLPLGAAPLDAPGRAIAVSGTIACIATASSLQVCDVSDFTRPRALASLPLDVRAITISGTRAFVVTASQLVIVDISVPAAPAVMGRADTSLPPGAVAVSGSLAFVVVNVANRTDLGVFQVYDVSNPALPTRLIGLSTGGLARSVAASGSFAYVVNQGSNTLLVYNISTPAQPVLVGSTTFNRAPQDMVVVGTTGYVTLTGSGQIASNSLKVVDLSNPAAPVIVGSVVTGTLPTGLALSGNYAFVTGINTGLQVFDVTSPTSPSLISGIATVANPAGVAVTDFAFVVSDTAQIQIFGGRAGVAFSSLVTADLKGNATTATNASQLGGQPASFYSDASNLSAGILANARTTGTPVSTANTLVLRDVSGNFAAGTITAALNGNASSATTAATATNATQLGGQPAAFYTNASNITTGTLADARLTGNVAKLNTDNSFTSTRNSFVGRVGVNTPAGALELDVNGRINVAQGVIQKDLSAGVVTGTTDLGLYSQIAGGWIRFVTNNAQFAWFSDSGAGTTPRMVLSPAGNLSVTGSLSKGGGSFKIDHPLDPENKYLYHSFVESPDMMNVYNGNAITDADGYATITLPDYFEALNRDFRYQLTVVDENAPDVHFVRIASKVGVVGTNQFVIKSTPGNMEVSWQVTGIRKDAWAEKNRIPNSVDKVGDEKGRYLHPEAFGKPASQGVRAVPADAAAVKRE